VESARVDPSDLAGVWRAVLAAVAGRNALSWVGMLQLTGLDKRVAHVAAAPGKREVLRFFSDRQKNQLADLLRDITGQRYTIQLDQPANATAATATPTTPDRPTSQQRREALSLPLVKQILDLFDAELVDVRQQDGDAAEETRNPNDE